MDTYFWAVETSNGIITEYDIQKGTKNKWSDVPLKDVKKIFLFPYTAVLLRRISSSSHDKRVANPLLPRFEVVVPSDATPLVFRDCEITLKSFKKCGECGEEFAFKYEDGTFFKPRHSSRIYIICPNCGMSNGFVCTECNHFVRDTEGKTVCPACGKHTMWKFKSNISDGSREERHTEYHIGYKRNGVKVEQVIDEMGNSKIV